MNSPIGIHVRYKNSDDKKEYVVVDYSPESIEYKAEIAIIQEFPYYPNIIRQLKIWQSFSLFEIVG